MYFIDANIPNEVVDAFLGIFLVISAEFRVTKGVLREQTKKYKGTQENAIFR
jgi:hypothetical protein